MMHRRAQHDQLPYEIIQQKCGYILMDFLGANVTEGYNWP